MKIDPSTLEVLEWAVQVKPLLMHVALEENAFHHHDALTAKKYAQAVDSLYEARIHLAHLKKMLHAIVVNEGEWERWLSEHAAILNGQKVESGVT